MDQGQGQRPADPHAGRLAGEILEIFSGNCPVTALHDGRGAQLGGVHGLLVAAAEGGERVGHRIHVLHEIEQAGQAVRADIAAHPAAGAIEAGDDVAVGVGRVGHRDATVCAVAEFDFAVGAVERVMGIVRPGGGKVAHLAPHLEAGIQARRRPLGDLHLHVWNRNRRVVGGSQLQRIGQLDHRRVGQEEGLVGPAVAAAEHLVGDGARLRGADGVRAYGLQPGGDLILAASQPAANPVERLDHVAHRRLHRPVAGAGEVDVPADAEGLGLVLVQAERLPLTPVPVFPDQLSRQR